MDPHGGFEYRKDFSWSDRNFPTQPSMNYLYRSESDESYVTAVSRFMFRIARLTDPRQRFLLEEPSDWTIEQMASSPLQTSVFAFLANLARARVILEIGTFIGLGAMQLARGVPDDCRLVTVEKYAPFADIARRNVERNELSSRIDVLTGEIQQLIETGVVAGPYDMILIDGGKEHYEAHLRLTIDLLSPRGFIIIDNAFFLGDAVNELPSTEKGNGVRRCLEFASSRPDLELAFLPFSDGMLLVRRVGQ
jgi:predicted O-methyltransferase YrrM